MDRRAKLASVLFFVMIIGPILTLMIPVSSVEGTLNTVDNHNMARNDDGSDDLAWAWSKGIGNILSNQGNEIAVDENGDVFVTGEAHWFDSDISPNFGNTSFNNSEKGIFVAKMDSMGNWLWATKAGSGEYTRVHSIATDSDGNAYITGQYQSSTMNFGSITIDSDSCQLCGAGFVAKIDTDGNWIWATDFEILGPTSISGDHSMDVDDSGNVFIVGHHEANGYSSMTFGTDELSINCGSSSSDDCHNFIAKIDGNGTWQSAFEIPHEDFDIDQIYDIAADLDGNIFITGRGRESSYEQYRDQLIVAKITQSGNMLWITKDGGSDFEVGYSIAVDSLGDVFVTGYFTGENSQFDGNSLTSMGGSDIFVAKYNGDSGIFHWVESGGGLDEQYGYDIAIDSDDNAFIVGYYEGGYDVTFGTHSLENAGTNDIFIVKISSEGTWINAYSAGGQNYDRGLNIDVSLTGQVFVTGWFSDSVQFGNIVIDRGSSHSDGSYTFIATLSPDSDNDGVPDAADNCPDTAQGFAADENGCSASQRDTDEDGLVDSLDQCPGTESGIEVDEVGCWWGQFDYDGDGVQNSEDNCPEWFGEDCASPEWVLNQHSKMWPAHYPASEPNNRGSPIHSLAYSPDGSMIASASSADDEGVIAIVWDPETGEKITTISCAPGECIGSFSVAFSPDSSLLAISHYYWPDFPDVTESKRSEVVIFNTTTWAGAWGTGGYSVSSIGWGYDVIDSISFSPDGSMVAFITQDYVDFQHQFRVKIFHTSNWSIARSIQFSDSVYSIDFSSSGEFLAVSHSNQFTIYNVSNWTSTVSSSQFDAVEISIPLDDVENSLRPEYNGTSNLVTHLEFSPNGLWLITASLDGNIRIWSAMDWQLLGDYPIHYVPIHWGPTGGMIISPDSSTVLSWTDYSPNPGYVSLELNSGNQERLGLSGCGILVFSPNGKILASGDSCSGSIVLYEGDSDGDGILESYDTCPNTDQNAEVNSQGCASNQVDSDGDGVYDYQDQCAGTVDGATVDSIGCAMTQLDSDADGISDATDQCLNTPTGESVGLNGCSSSQVDSDGDGIYDSNDDCPSTPDGSSVEANGCATSGDDVVDLDSDSDGVRDSVDQCSNTDSGVIVGSSGCETEGDVQGTSNEELSDDAYAFIGCLVLIGIIAAIAFVVRSVNTSPRTSIYDHGYTHFDQGGTGVEMQSVMDELEQQRAQAQMEAQRLKLQLNEQSASASQMATIQAELANLLQRVEDSEHAKRQMEQDMEEMRKKGDSSLLMQDSVTMGDNLVGSTKIGSQTVIGPDPESMAKAFKIIQDDQPKREGLVTRFLRWLFG